MDEQGQIERLKQNFEGMRPALAVPGDETRRHTLLASMETACDEGMHANEITERTSLSRPAISHQMKVLKDLCLARFRKEDAGNFCCIGACCCRTSPSRPQGSSSSWYGIRPA